MIFIGFEIQYLKGPFLCGSVVLLLDTFTCSFESRLRRHANIINLFITPIAKKICLNKSDVVGSLLRNEVYTSSEGEVDCMPARYCRASQETRPEQTLTSPEQCHKLSATYAILGFPELCF